MVISGMISDEPGRHTLTVSRSVPYEDPAFQGVEQCVVTVTDQDGNMMFYTGDGEGVYSANIPDSYLEVGDAVSVYVVTPDGREYRSSYDTIFPCPVIDSVYWELSYRETSDGRSVLSGHVRVRYRFTEPVMAGGRNLGILGLPDRKSQMAGEWSDY
jgi:hypothetical protein